MSVSEIPPSQKIAVMLINGSVISFLFMILSTLKTYL